MAGTNFHQVITPIPVQPARHSLLSSAPVVSEPDARWESGLAWVPNPCGTGGFVFDPCDTTDLSHQHGGTVGDSGDYVPFGVAVIEDCSTFGFAAVDVRARARTGLDIARSALIASEFWTGAQARASGWDNQFLAKAPTQLNSGAATGAIRALADLEYALGNCSRGGRGFIHANRVTVTYWIANRLVTQEGNRLLTYLGTEVVADEGYDGSGPTSTSSDGAVFPSDHATAWAYATGLPEVRLGTVQVLDPTSGQIATENSRVAVAMQQAAVIFDACCHLAIKVTHS